jgi:hypothetical protein
MIKTFVKKWENKRRIGGEWGHVGHFQLFRPEFEKLTSPDSSSIEFSAARPERSRFEHWKLLESIRLASDGLFHG